MSPDLWNVLAVAVQLLIVITVSSLALIIIQVGFSLIFGFPKLRKGGGKTLTVRSLDEQLGTQAEYFAPTAPRGPADQLATPELLEVHARKSG